VKKWLIGGGVVVVVAIFVVLNLVKGGSKVDVQTEEVSRRDITKKVSASGNIRAKRQLDVSASSIGKVTALAVHEGDKVKKGDFLLEIDPTGYESVVEQLEGAIRAGEAALDMEKANLDKAKYDLAKAETLFKSQLVSEEALRSARLSVDVSEGRVKSAEENLYQQRANLKKARHDLNEVRITADMSGTITALNVDEGESAIMGTLNNPGTVLLTISDLSEIEAEVLVDETEVVFVKVGQPATVSLDAHPDTTYKGVVTEVGNSAVRSQLGLGQTSVDFKVVVAVKDSIPNVRPGLSASVEIDVAEVKNALSIPIQCLTLRKKSELSGPGKTARKKTEEASGAAPDTTGPGAKSESGKGEDEEVEGVFVVENGKAVFKPTVVGIAGSSYFQVIKGPAEGDKVIVGPFKAINDLKDGDPVKVTEKSSAKRSRGSS
jgi:HlyD family secretion protein